MSVSIGDVIGTITLKENFTTVSKDVVTKFEQLSNRISTIGTKVSATLNKSFNIPGGTLGSVAALTAVYYGLAKAIQAVGREVVEGEKVQAQLRAGVESTGRAAGYTAEQLLDMADSLMKVSSFDDEVIAGGEALLLTFNRIRGQQFFSAMTDAMDVAARKGVDLNTAVTMIGKAYSGSIEGLRKAGVVLTDSQSKQIKSLFDTGQEIKAQILLHQALQTAVGGSAAAMRDTMGGAIDALKVRWGNLLQTVGNSNSGPFRVGIEGMIKLIDWLVENWGALESAVLETLADIIEAMADWADLTLGNVERVGRAFIRLAELNPFSDKRGTEWGKKFLDGLSSGREGLHEAAEGFRIKAEEALDGAGKSATKAAVSFGDLATETGALSQQQTKLINTSDDLAKSISDLNTIAQRYRSGATPEEIDTLEEAQKLTKQYLSDVEEYGERAALALRKLRVEESAARVEAERAETIWKGVLARRQQEAEIARNAAASIRQLFDSLQTPLATLEEFNRRGNELRKQAKKGEEERLAAAREINRQLSAGNLTQEQANLLLREQADLWVEIQSTSILAAEEFYRTLADRLAQVGDQISAVLAGELVDALRTGRLESERLGDALQDVLLNTAADLIQQWLSAWFKAMADWLVRWIATQAAAKAAQAGLGAASSATGGGIGSNLTGAGAAGKVASNWWSGSSGQAAGAGYAAGFAIVAAIAINWLKTKGTPWAKSVLNIGGSQGIEIGQGSFGRQGASGKDIANNVRQTLSQAQEIMKFVTDFIASIGGQIDKSKQIIGSMSIEKKGQGKSTQWIVTTIEGLVRNFGNDMEAAMNYAAIQALKATPTIGLSPEIATVIKNSVAETLEALQHDIEIGLSVLHDRLGNVGSQVYDAIRAFTSKVDEAARLGLTIDSGKLTDDINAIRNSLLGIDTAFSDFLESLISFNRGIDESVIGLRNTLEDKLKKAQDSLAELLASGPQSFELPSGRIKTQTEEQWKVAIRRLEESITDYIKELDKLPRKLSDAEIDASIFDGLFRYFKGNKELEQKYAAQALQYARARLIIEFEILKQRLIEMNKWIQFAGMLEDAFNAANAALDMSVNPPKAPRSGGGTDRKSLREDLRDEIAGLQAEAKGPLHKVFFDLKQSIKDFIERCKEAKLPADEMAAGIAASTKRFKEDMRARADLAAGIGTDFTRKLQDTVKLFQELKDLGREKTGIPDWLLRVREGQALGNLGSELQAMLDAFNGLVNPMLSITSQADALRQNVLAFAEAAGWSAEQIAAAMQQIRDGAEFQRQQAIGGIMGKLFGYLKGNEKFEQQRQAFELKMIDLDFRLMEAQLRALNAWDAVTEEIFNAAHAAARDLSEAADDIVNSIPEPPAIDIPQIMRDAVQRFRQGVSDFITSTQAYFTDESVTALTQQEQEQAARDRYNQLLEQANAGNIDAINQLDAARRELLAEIAESQGGTGTSGYLAEFRNIMAQSAQFLQNAQGLEAQVANAAAEAAMQNANQNAENITTAIYDSAQMLADAIWEAIGVVPMMARGGIITRGAPLVRVHAPEAIVPLARFNELTSRFNLGYNGFGGSNDQDMVNSITSARRDRDRSLFSDFHTNPVSNNMLRTMKDMDDMRRMDYSETRDERKKLLQHLQRQKRDNRELHNTLDRVRQSNDRIAKSNQDMNTMERRKALRRK